MRIVAVVLVLAVLASSASAQTTLTFRGDTFVRKYEVANAKGGLVEFVPPQETVENWTQLVGYRAFFDNNQSPVEAARTIARLATERYAGANPRLLTKGGEALVDFVLVSGDGTLEFNVFKYARGSNGRGIVTLQYARRFRGLDADDVRALCARWVAEAAEFDMQVVRRAIVPQGGDTSPRPRTS